MGMYNVLNREAPCPKCGNVVQWQSKELLYDSYELANVLRRIDLGPGMDGEMHSSLRGLRHLARRDHHERAAEADSRDTYAAAEHLISQASSAIVNR